MLSNRTPKREISLKLAVSRREDAHTRMKSPWNEKQKTHPRVFISEQQSLTCRDHLMHSYEDLPVGDMREGLYRLETLRSKTMRANHTVSFPKLPSSPLTPRNC